MGTEHDIGRMKKLEGELQRLIDAVDTRLSEAPAARRPIVDPVDRSTWPKAERDWDLSHLAVVAGIGALLVTAGWAGSSLFYSSRLKEQIEGGLRPYAAELADTVTIIQTDLEPRMAVADELKAEIDQARRDLLARDEELETTLTAAQGQLLSIRDSAIDDIERRLSDQTDDLSTMLEMFRQRAVELDQGLDEISQALAAFDHQLPVLTDGFGEVAALLVDSRTMIDRTTNEVAALEGKAPPLLTALDQHKQDMDGGTRTLAILQAQLEALKTQTTRSSQQLDQVLDEGRTRIAGWESVDREIDTRKQAIMSDLDHYADSLNNRVREFLEVLNNEAAFTGG